MSDSVQETPRVGSRHFLRAFADLLRLPRAFWIIIGVFMLDNMAYYGMLTLMTTYLGTDMGWGEAFAHPMVSMFTMMVTVFMLVAGSFAEGFGLRRALLFALFIGVGGRALYSYAYQIPGAPPSILAVFGALLIVALATAIIQPVCYSAVKQYTDEKSNAMGYGLLYAFMNLGMVLVGAISAWVRPGVERLLQTDLAASGSWDSLLLPLARRTESGVMAVNWVCTGISGFALLWFALVMTRRRETQKIRPEAAREVAAEASAVSSRLGGFLRRTRRRVWSYFVEGPFRDLRFLFFIFMLLPVRTLFAHQWLTFPQYILRAYPQSVSDRMEWVVNWINPLVIFIGVPIATALTRNVHVYKAMMIGTLVSALPVFLLAPGPNLPMLIAYFVIFSMGECLWSARFYEYSAEIAPPGRMAQYMGLASIPWLLAKGTTGLYSGRMLAEYVPDNVAPEQMRSGMMWLIYGCIAMTTPIGLWLARGWAMKGMKNAE